MPVRIIAAVASNGVIGKDGKLPWSAIKEDLTHFKRLTDGCRVVMGRRTWESLPGPLEGRECAVVSKTARVQAPAKRFRSFGDAVGWFEDIWAIGGTEIYRAAIDDWRCRSMHITRIARAYDGDTYFPWDAVDWDEWQLIDSYAGETPGLTFCEYRRRPQCGSR